MNTEDLPHRLGGRRVVIVSGASSGIGEAIAKRFAGCSTVYNLDIRRGVGSDGCVHWMKVDVTDWAAVDQAVQEVLERHGSVDVAIANAGISIRHRFVDIEESDARRILDVNLLGVMSLWRAALARMVPRKSGVLLATASTNGSAGYPMYADYNASKAGVLALCRTLALEYAPYIRTGCVSPGYVLTPMQKQEYSASQMAAVNSRIPLLRHASPQEVAEVFYFLASPSAQYLTGQEIILDGGELAGGVASMHGQMLGAESVFHGTRDAVPDAGD